MKFQTFFDTIEFKRLSGSGDASLHEIHENRVIFHQKTTNLGHIFWVFRQVPAGENFLPTAWILLKILWGNFHTSEKLQKIFWTIS